ncbi:hypothetical protein DPSP01_002269 [Paraphaeosphaeria sporulosa]
MNLFSKDSHDRYFHPSKEATDASGPRKMTIAPAGLRFGRRCRAIKRISPRELFTITEVHETWVIHNGMMGSRGMRERMPRLLNGPDDKECATSGHSSSHPGS